MKHVIVTRCKFGKDEEFQKYFEVMKKTYIPSINSQTNKNFFISLCVNPKHFDLIRKEIDESILYWCDKTHHLRKKIELADHIMMDLTDEVWAKLHNDTRKQ